VHRRDVRAALADPVPAPRKPFPARPAPVLGPWKALIEEWLAADLAAPPKQRHTARRVWQRLVEEQGARIGEGTVRRYVAEVRARQEISPAQVIVPQTHLLGAEAEVDFGTVSVVLAGVAVDVQLFVLRLSASGKGFARAYLNEGQEVFLDGHVRAFEHLGGCPGRTRYDNLKAAVSRVLRGRDRLESDRFVALRSHYRFDSFFCQPGIKGSHEKGGVEGEVGRFRRRHLVPVPHVGSMAELNELIGAGTTADDDRHVGHRVISVGEHFALEAPELGRLPDEPFDVTIGLSPRVDRKARISVRNCLYSVPARYVGQRVQARLGAEVLEVFDGARLVASHPRGLKGDEVLTLDHYLEVLAIKPGALAGATALARAHSRGRFGPIHQQFWDLARRQLGDQDGTRALIEVLLIHRSQPHEAVLAGIQAALRAGSIDPAVIAIEARRMAEAASVIVPIGASLSRFDRPVPSVAAYDQLLQAR
jgi:transposase